MARYDARATEAKWQRMWDERRTFAAAAEPGRAKCYVLEMYPYPSGRIHMGHVRNYTMGDVLARYKRAQGFNVLHPDGLGRLRPAGGERRDGEGSVHPAAWTYDNIATHAQPASSAMGLSLRLETARSQPAIVDVLLPPPAGACSSISAGAGPGLPQVESLGQLGSGRQYRSRQRAGDRRARLALGRAVVEQRKLRAVVLQDHGLCRGPSGGARDAGSLAGEGPHDAGQLDRPLRGHGDPTSRAGRRSDGHSELEVFTTRHDTLYGASLLRSLARPSAGPEIAADRTPELAAFIAALQCRKAGTS